MIHVAKGLPQGSILGPLLFLLGVKDLPEVVSCPVRPFANDSKLFSGMCTKGDALKMQADLDVLVKCSESWQIPFNEDECNVMHVGSANQELGFHMSSFQLDR